MRVPAHIKHLKFNDSSSVEFKPNDMIVFTGANNAEKSQVLREIQDFIPYGRIIQ